MNAVGTSITAIRSPAAQIIVVHFTCTCDQGYFGDGFECELNYASMIRYKIAALHVKDEKQVN